MPNGKGENNSSSSSSSSEDEAARFIPKSAKGWQGGDLELDHAREAFEQHKSKTVAAVDISQFQNTEIGKGYQAKHVVRQRGAGLDAGNEASGTLEVKDMSQPNTTTITTSTTTTTTTTTTARSKDKKKSKKRKEPPEEIDTPRIRLNKYLNCPGMVAFRKEIENILAS